LDYAKDGDSDFLILATEIPSS